MEPNVNAPLWNKMLSTAPSGAKIFTPPPLVQAQSQTPPLSTASTKLTRGTSCVLCQKRKVKCDKQKPCSNCTKVHKECIFAPAHAHTGGPRRRVKKVLQNSSEDGGLQARLRWCESILRRLGVDVDDDDREVAVIAAERELAKQPQEQRIKQSDSMSPTVSCDEDGKFIVEGGQPRYIENKMWTELSDEFREHKITPHSPSSDEAPEPQPHIEGSSILFGRRSSASLFAYHPSPVHIFKLWQTCLDNVNPLVKLFHAPTVQTMIIEAVGDLDTLPPASEALMFAIYLSAVTSLSEADCQSMFSEERMLLQDRYADATAQALVNARLFSCSNMVVLQAFTLFLLSMRSRLDTSSMWIFAGIGKRIGQRLGLHREEASRELSLFESEMRRRLWWQVIILDHRSAQLSGAAASRPSPTFLSDLRRPLNVNDSDLNPSMEVLPVEHTGMTEMGFCAIRYEFGEYFRKSAEWAFPSGADNATVSVAEKDVVINALEATLEQKYIRFCDPSIPLHLLSAGIARTVISYLRFMAHHPRHMPDKGASLPQSEKDLLLATCLQIMEYDHFGHTEKCVAGYLWHIDMYFQLDAFIYILSELKVRVAGETVDRAWRQVAEVYDDHPNFLSDTRNALYFAIGNLVVKAWDRRVAEMRFDDKGAKIETPEFVHVLKSQRVKKPSAAKVSTARPLPPLTASQLYPADASLEGVDLGLPSSYIPMDVDPLDWDYWQMLLEGCDLPMMGTT